jgi:hypothetical protein
MSQTSMEPNAIRDGFKQSLKPSLLEEFVDYYFFRRGAYLILPLLFRLKITPNQVTTLSLMVGLMAAFFVWHQHFVVGALFAIMAVFLDCCDGQIARLTDQISEFGRILDGVFDAVWITALWLAIYFSGYFQTSSPFLFWLMVGAAVSTYLHCWRFDGARLRYLELAEPLSSDKVNDLDVTRSVQTAKRRFKQGRYFEALLTFLNTIHNTIAGRSHSERGQVELSAVQRQKIKTELDPAIARWPWIGEGHHNALVVLGLLLAEPFPQVLIGAFWIILVPMNLWFLYCEWGWRRGLKRVRGLLVGS